MVYSRDWPYSDEESNSEDYDTVKGRMEELENYISYTNELLRSCEEDEDPIILADIQQSLETYTSELQDLTDEHGYDYKYD